MAATVISFGEWLPDQPELGNPGLIEANNVYPSSDYYIHFNGLATLPGGALPATGRGLTTGVLPSASNRYYAGTVDRLYMTDAGGTFVSRSAATFTALTALRDWDFLQFAGKMIAAQIGTLPMYHTIGAATNFATLGAGAAPAAAFVGQINQFVVLGNVLDSGGTARPATIRWSGLENEQSWPPPNSATAIAQQSGEQDLDERYGEVLKIVGGDQFGLVFQTRAITRVTYVGPPVVFQFDTFEKTRGLYSSTSVVPVGTITHFLAQDGFFATDGVSVTPTGYGKVDKYALLNTPLTTVRGSYSVRKRCVLWSVGAQSSILLHMNVENFRWSRADQKINGMTLVNEQGVVGGEYSFDPLALDGSNRLCDFTGTAQPAKFVTSEIELNPGGRFFLSGVKPNIEFVSGAVALTVRIGTRDDLSAVVSYTATTTPTTRTGFADFRVDAKYMRAEVNAVGLGGGRFNKATGIVVKAFLTGET